MEITVCDINGDFIRHFPAECGLSLVQGSIVDLECDAVVSPANSFGFMDGGVDYVYSIRFGWGVQQAVMDKINELPFGELLVGQALIVETGSEKIPYLISAPTMRVPKVISDPADIMLACRAATHAAISKGLKSLAFPGMGTGCGRVRFDIAATAMLAGINAALSPKERPDSWREAQERHFKLLG